jgi:mannose-6-phosphate isomerase-like protein (cupin superfamily)
MEGEKYWKQTDADGIEPELGVHAGEGLIKIRRFFYGQSRLAARFHVWELAPGATEGDHTHAGDYTLEEIYYFLQGQGELTVEGRAVPVRPGDAVLVPPGVDHGLRNTGPEPLRLVLVFGPPQA